MRTERQQAVVFKKIFHHGRPTQFLTLKRGKFDKTVVRSYFGTLKSLWGTLNALNIDEYNVFMIINNVSSKTRTSADVTSINAFFIDYDKGDWSADNKEEFLAKFSITPHMVIETSPGNFHVYWLVEDVPLEEFKEVQQKLAAMYGADEKVCDLPRVMRIPGTINWKHGDSFRARIVYVDDDAQPLSYRKFISDVLPSGAGAEPDAGVPTKTVVSTKNSNADANIDGLEQALKDIPADDRKVWITVGMALHHCLGTGGLPLFKEWSAKSPKYDEPELERQWKSFRPGGRITIRTLFWLAQIHSANGDVGDQKKLTNTSLLELTKHFAQASANLLRHCEDTRSWYVFDFGKWERSDKAAVRVATSYLLVMKGEAAKSKDEKYREFVERQQSPGSVRELLRAAESDRDLSTRSDVFDQAPNILGVRIRDTSGAIECCQVIRLNDTKSRYAKPDDMLLRIAGAEYDSAAQCPQWMQFLDEVTVGDKDLSEFLQRAVGYSLYGHTNEQVMFVLIGSGGNGKGVFSRIIYSLFGDYAALMQSNLLKPGAINANSPSPALMKLMSKRIWVCSEVPKGMVMDEALTKQITGGDLVSSRHLYGDQVEFLPVGKLWLSVNNMPRVRHDDKGMWRRIVAIPFKAVFTGKDRDNDLERKLEGELPGILNWALDGARKYAEKGKLGRPRASKELMTNLRREVDTVGLWIKSRCVISVDGTLQSKLAYDDYCEAMKRERVAPMPQKDFKADLERRGYRHKQTRSHNLFQGLSIKAD